MLTLNYHMAFQNKNCHVVNPRFTSRAACFDTGVLESKSFVLHSNLVLSLSSGGAL